MPVSAELDERKGANVSARLIEQLSKLLSLATDSTTLAEGILTIARERLNATRGVLAEMLPNDEFAVLAAAGFQTPTALGKLISTSVMKQIVERKEALLLGDAQAEGDKPSPSITRNNIRAVACAPAIGINGELKAILYFDNQFSTSDFGRGEAEFLVWIGHVWCLLSQNIAAHRLLKEEVQAERISGTGTQIVAASRAMGELLRRVEKAAKSQAAILILGESGSGKERIANLIHSASERSSRPFVAINCAAIPNELFESELFGHKKGAFSNAVDRLGAFREADSGTLFLDEIGDLDYELQSKLLRAVQEKKVRPVGFDRDVPVDVRLICATNKDLPNAIARRQFREDFYYRIATVTLTVPPLRDRRDDIAPLARHFVRLFSDGTKALSSSAADWLAARDWPGNVRQLRGVIEQAVIFSEQNTIAISDLDGGRELGRINLSPNTLADVERRHIYAILKSVNGNKSETAKILGIARSTLVLKLKEYGE